MCSFSNFIQLIEVNTTNILNSNLVIKLIYIYILMLITKLLFNILVVLTSISCIKLEKEHIDCYNECYVDKINNNLNSMI
jgi:hypothetical protein